MTTTPSIPASERFATSPDRAPVWRRAWVAAAMAGAFASSAMAIEHGSGSSVGNVDVLYAEPALVIESNRIGGESGGWTDELSRYVADRVSRAVPAGQRVTVTIKDVRRAGAFEGWHGARLADVRIVRDVTPPRIDLSYTVSSAQGDIISQGERRLRKLDFLNRPTRFGEEPLRFEKNLVDDWVAVEFKQSR